MAKASTYATATPVVGDYLLGTDDPGGTPLTRNFTISALATLLDANTATLTNKTINLASNTLTGTTAQFNTALSDGSFATLAGTETLTNKTLTAPIIATISNTGTLTLPTSTDTLVGRATTDTLSNKTFPLVTVAASANANAIAITGYSLTGSNASSLLDAAGTLNTTGVVSVFKSNITNTASGAGSKHLDFQLSSTRVFSVNIAGNMQAKEAQVASDGLIGFSSTTAVDGTADVILRRDAANVLALRNTTNAQTFRVYNTRTDASNGEWGFMRFSSNVLEIGSAANGSGSARDVRIQVGSGNTVFSANSTTAAVWKVLSSVGANLINGFIGLDSFTSTATKIDPSSNGRWSIYSSTGAAIGAAGDLVFAQRQAGGINNNILPYVTGGVNRFITQSSGTTGGASSAGAGNQYIEITVNGVTYKCLHDGTV